MFSKTLLSSLLLALSVSANPIAPRDGPVKLSISRHLNFTGVHNVLKHDQARARHLAKKGSTNFHTDASNVNEPATNVAEIYVASVGVGSPATQYSLIIDTGSSNTWIGAGKSYVKTSTSKKTSDSVSVTYGSGSFSGTEYTDTVTLGSLVIPGQSIGVASSANGFSGFDGILGIGPVALTQGTLSPSTSKSIPTVTDNAFSQKKISANQIGISFEPTTSTSTQNGELTWGGVDSTKLTGSISYAPVTSTSPASFYWGVDQSITYGSTTILSSTAGIVDTGTTLVLIATDAFNTYQSATGATLDSTTGLLKITSSRYKALKTLNFKIGGKTYGLTPNAQIWPRSLNTAIGGSSSSIYLVVADLGSSSGSGLDFIDGYTFLERFYTVYDTANARIGFATTSFTTATTN